MARDAQMLTSNPGGKSVIAELFERAKRRDDSYFDSFTDNALYQVSNIPPAYGPKGIRDLLAPIMSLCEGVDHFIDKLWEVGNNRFVCQGSVLYHRRDHKTVPLIHVCNIIGVEGNKISELRAFGDFSPLFNPPDN
jgi:hypothetical protein